MLEQPQFDGFWIFSGKKKLIMLKEIKYQKQIRSVPTGSLGFSPFILYVRCLELIESFRSRTSSSKGTTFNNAY